MREPLGWGAELRRPSRSSGLGGAEPSCREAEGPALGPASVPPLCSRRPPLSELYFVSSLFLRGISRQHADSPPAGAMERDRSGAHGDGGEQPAGSAPVAPRPEATAEGSAPRCGDRVPGGSSAGAVGLGQPPAAVPYVPSAGIAAASSPEF